MWLSWYLTFNVSQNLPFGRCHEAFKTCYRRSTLMQAKRQQSSQDICRVANGKRFHFKLGSQWFTFPTLGQSSHSSFKPIKSILLNVHSTLRRPTPFLCLLPRESFNSSKIGSSILPSPLSLSYHQLPRIEAAGLWCLLSRSPINVMLYQSCARSLQDRPTMICRELLDNMQPSMAIWIAFN